MKKSLLAVLFTVFISCELTASEFVRDDIIRNPSHERFSVCYNNSCKTVVELSLPTAVWQHLTQDWIPVALSPEEERERIKLYISRMEQLIGPMTGTDKDLPGVFRGVFKLGQMDCIDEATNTTTYLRLLEQAGHLHWHSVLSPKTRFVLPFSWPHTAAVIKEHDSDNRYIVDSWFEANGEEPHVVSLLIWKKGWKPGRGRHID